MDGRDRDKLLDYKIANDMTVRAAGGVTFATWCLSKINNLQFFNADVQKISALSHGHPGKEMEDDVKIDFMETLVKLGVIKLD